MAGEGLVLVFLVDEAAAGRNEGPCRRESQPKDNYLGIVNPHCLASCGEPLAIAGRESFEAFWACSTLDFE